MRSDVFLRRDIQAILNALAKAQADIVAHLPDDELTTYTDGFMSGLRAVAVALHIQIEDVSRPPRHRARILPDAEWLELQDLETHRPLLLRKK